MCGSMIFVTNFPITKDESIIIGKLKWNDTKTKTVNKIPTKLEAILMRPSKYEVCILGI